MLLCLGIAACSSNNGSAVDSLGIPENHPVTQAELRRLPESALLYPGSRLVRRIGSDEHAQRNDHEPDPAYAGVVAVAAVSASALLDWYAGQMQRRGYHPAAYYRLATQSDGRAWTIPGTREQIQVAVYADARTVAGDVPAGKLAYEELLVNYRVTGPPP